jgi:hypothetical protein
MLGALNRACRAMAPGELDDVGRGAVDALMRAESIRRWTSLASANDAAESVSVVLGYFDEAIALLPPEAS